MKTREICAPILDNNDENITIEAINQTKQTEIIKQLEGNYSHSATNDILQLQAPWGAATPLASDWLT